MSAAVIPFISARLAPLKPASTELLCEGSGQKPVIIDRKPHCKVCGQRFRYQDLINRVTEIPEHE